MIKQNSDSKNWARGIKDVHPDLCVLKTQGAPADPPDAKCPYCGKSKKSCSYVDSLSRSWARDACKNRKIFQK